MRVMLKAELDTEKTGEAIKAGKLPQVMLAMVDRLQPEAAYFGPSHGKRSCLFVFDMQDSADLPALAEPLFDLGASLEVQPVMNAEDMQKGLAVLQR